jgi:hypothetical protein
VVPFVPVFVVVTPLVFPGPDPVQFEVVAFHRSFIQPAMALAHPETAPVVILTVGVQEPDGHVALTKGLKLTHPIFGDQA